MSELGEIHIDPEQDAAPMVPAHGPVDWMKKNLFSSTGNTILTRSHYY